MDWMPATGRYHSNDINCKKSDFVMHVLEYLARRSQTHVHYL